MRRLKKTSYLAAAMSGLPPLATELRRSLVVRFVPILLQKSFCEVGLKFSQPQVQRLNVILPHYVGRTETELRLCQLGPTPPAREVWSLTRRTDRNDAPIRAVANHIASIFAQEQALFE